MKKIIFVTTANGYQLEKCLEFDFFKKQIFAVVSDRDCRALEISNKFGVNIVKINKNQFNEELLEFCNNNQIDFIVSQNNKIIFNMDILIEYKNRIFNLHNSILPAFKGAGSSEKNTKYKIGQIFERTLEFKSLVAGVTIHIVSNNIDEGQPVIVSVLNIPYEYEEKILRHKMFIQEVKLILQLVKWIEENRIIFSCEMVRISNAKFNDLEFTPNLDNNEILNLES